MDGKQNQNTIIVKLKDDDPITGLKRGDYFALQPQNGYNGAGVYGLSSSGGKVKYACCIERTNGDIQVNDMRERDARVMTAKSFRRQVKYKLLARIAVEMQTSPVAKADFDAILSRGNFEA